MCESRGRNMQSIAIHQVHSVEHTKAMLTVKPCFLSRHICFLQPHLPLGVQKVASGPIDAPLELWFKTLMKKMAGNETTERR